MGQGLHAKTKRHCDADADRRLVAAATELVSRGLVVGSLGNVSLRVADGMRITPTRIPHLELTPADLVFIDGNGTRRRGHHAPSLEWPLHAAVYAARADIHAAVHTHSVYATAWSCTGRSLPSLTEDFLYYDIGQVQVTEVRVAGSPELAKAAVRILGDSRAVLLGCHGLLTVAATVEEALTIAEVVERQAQIAWLLMQGSTAAVSAPLVARPPGK